MFDCAVSQGPVARGPRLPEAAAVAATPGFGRPAPVSLVGQSLFSCFPVPPKRPACLLAEIVEGTDARVSIPASTLSKVLRLKLFERGGVCGCRSPFLWFLLSHSISVLERRWTA